MYRCHTEGEPVFVEVPAPTDEALQTVLLKIITRMMKLLTRKGVLVEEQGQAYMADDDSDSDEARTLRPLQAAACTYRIAFGPRAGQKVLTVQGAMPRDADFKQTLCADIDGFSLHAAVPRFGQRTRASQRGRASRAQAQDPLARRHHAPGDVAAGVHAAAGGAGDRRAPYRCPCHGPGCT